MYLSRLHLNPRSPAVRCDLADYQGMHRTVLSLFPALPPKAGSVDARQHFGVLHRVDIDPRTGRPTLLVQSREAPNFSRLPNQYLLETSGSPRNPDHKRVDEHYGVLHEGMQLAFRLRANPTKKIDTKTGPDGERRNGKRVDLRGDEEWWKWLWRKGRDGGFGLLSVGTGRLLEDEPGLGSNVPDVRVTAERRQWGKRAPAANSESGGKHLVFASVLFEGVLQVTDAERFRQTLEHGIGSGKAYGFGLLSIAPLTAMRP